MNNRHRDERREDKRERGKDERRRAERGREERGSELGGLLIAAELEGRFYTCLDLDLGGLSPASN